MAKTLTHQSSDTNGELGSDSSAEHHLSGEELLAKRVSERVMSAWSTISIDLRPFVERVSSLMDCAEAPEAALQRVVVEDLFLAYACSLNDNRALQAFAEMCDSELRVLAKKLHISDEDFDDTRQRLWEKLFLASGAHAPKILEYSGKGELRSWFRIVAARSILDELRKTNRHKNAFANPLDSGLWETASAADPELESIRQRYKATFRQAFERAAGELEPQERNLLNCHYISSMSTDELGKAFGMHKATAARHVARARERLLERTRAQLKNHLGVDSGELDSVMRLIDGEMSVSLSRLLR